VSQTSYSTAVVRIAGIALGWTRLTSAFGSQVIGDAVAQAASDHGLGTLRSDANAIYPRSSRIMRWLEACALWCCSGWRTGKPDFSKLMRDGTRLFADMLTTPDSRVHFQRQLIGSLWSRRERSASIYEWLVGVRAEALGELLSDNMAAYEAETLQTFIDRCADGGDVHGMTLEQFAGDGEQNERVTLSSLHSAKGREFRFVILFAMDAGRIPRSGATESEAREARRAFYVGFTRPHEELHIVYSASRPSPFVTEVRRRMADPPATG